MQRLWLLAPLLIFLLLAVLFYGSLGKDPEYLPSALIGRPLPEFQLPTLEADDSHLGRAALIGDVALLNVWASWCYACRIEHPFLEKIANDYHVPLFGLNYKNDPDKARAWLARYGNPYRLSLIDRDGRLGIDLGVAGAPETFVFDADGVIHYRHIGIIDQSVWDDTLWPLINRLRGDRE